MNTQELLCPSKGNEGAQGHAVTSLKLSPALHCCFKKRFYFLCWAAAPQEFANVHVCLYSFAELAEFVKLFEKHLAMKGCI